MDDEAPNANLITNPDHVSDKDTPVVDSPNDAAATAVKTNADVASPRCAESAIITKANCPSRFSLWYALTIFSAVSLIAHCTETKTWLVEEKWVLSATVMSLLLSCIGCMAHIVMRDNFVGMPLEGLLLFTNLGFWVGGLIVMMDTNNSLAVNASGDILNPNLYFFSWLSLSLVVALLVGYGHEVNAATMVFENGAGYWAGISVASVVALASSLQTFFKGSDLEGVDYDCQNDPDDQESGYCKRLKFSISLGAISAVVTGTCCLLSFKMTNLIHGAVSGVVFLAWTIGVAFVTFGDVSPGDGVGNLYFGVWAAFIMSLFMVSTSVKKYLASRNEEQAAGTVNATGVVEMTVEEAPVSPTATEPATGASFDDKADTEKAPASTADIPTHVE